MAVCSGVSVGMEVLGRNGVAGGLDVGEGEAVNTSVGDGTSVGIGVVVSRSVGVREGCDDNANVCGAMDDGVPPRLDGETGDVATDVVAGL